MKPYALMPRRVNAEAVKRGSAGRAFLLPQRTKAREVVLTEAESARVEEIVERRLGEDA